VTLKCVSDGVPTPTLTWYKPGGIEINSVTAKESTVEVFLSDEHDFGEYKCTAYNGLDPSNYAPLPLAKIRMYQLNFQVLINAPFSYHLKVNQFT